jgi:hypothetical protein
MSVKNNFKVIVMYYTHGFGLEHAYNDKSRALSRELGFDIVDMEQYLDQYMKDNNIEKYFDSKLPIAYDDPHPSELTHKMISDELFNKITSTQ